MATRRKWHTRVHADFGPDAPDKPSWDHAKTLIGWLNGSDRTEVFLGEDGGPRFLAVSDGKGGLYVVVAQERKCYYTLGHLLDPSESAEEVEVIIGRLPDYLPPSRVHGLETVLSPRNTASGRGNALLNWNG